MHKNWHQNGSPPAALHPRRKRQKAFYPPSRFEGYFSALASFAIIVLSGVLVTQGDEPVPANLSAQSMPSPEFVRVNPGTFTPRRTPAEARSDERSPAHKVKISRPFLMSSTEVTNFQMVTALKHGIEKNYIETTAVSATMPKKRGETEVTLVNYQNSDITYKLGQWSISPGKENHPCTGVTWYGAQVYANLYSLGKNLTPATNTANWTCDDTSNGFRLPTESEWEFACHTGGVNRGEQVALKSQTDAHHINNSNHVNHSPSNAWGLFGMQGNVSEWCLDWHGATRQSLEIDPRGPDEGWRRIVRGSSYLNHSQAPGTAFRKPVLPFNDSRTRGFRIVRTLSQFD